MSGQIVTLGDLFQIGSSKRVLKSQWTTEGVPFYRGREITRLAAEGFVDNELFISEEHFSELAAKSGVPQAGDIVITAIGTIGNAHVVRESDRFYFKDASVLWMKRTSDVSSEFINLWLQSPLFFDQLDKGNGATVDTLPIQKLQSLRVSIPPLPEQHRIVAILDEAFDGIATAKANAEKNLQNARVLFESHLQSVFTARGEGWVEKIVGELVADGVLVKPFDGNHGEIHPRKTDYVESGVPFIMACDLQNGAVDTAGCKFIPRRLADSLRVGFAKDGDVLISHKGTIGRSAVVNTDLDYIMLTPQVTSYRIKDGARLLNRFVRYYFMSPVFQREMIAEAADGATRAYIGITKQLSLHFRFPSIEDQVRMVETFDVLDREIQRLESLYQRKLAALDELTQSLLHQAFSGAL
jgi:type I restriction enzyme S subunit